MNELIKLAIALSALTHNQFGDTNEMVKKQAPTIAPARIEQCERIAQALNPDRAIKIVGTNALVYRMERIGETMVQGRERVGGMSCINYEELSNDHN